MSHLFSMSASDLKGQTRPILGWLSTSVMRPASRILRSGPLNMNNLRNEGQPTLGSAIYEPAGALAKGLALVDSDLHEISRVYDQDWIYDWQSYIKR